MPRRYAQNTATPIARSRGEITKLLQDWGATAIQWTDEFEADKCTLRFMWKHDDTEYLARISIGLPGRDELEEEAWHGGLKRVHEGKLKKLMSGRGKQEHRLLLLWIKAALNAVDAGMVSAEAIFLPFFEDQQGNTVAEIAVPKLAKLRSGSAMKLLTS